MHKLVRTIMCLFAIVSKIGIILARPVGVSWASGTGMKEAAIHRDSYDVCFLGTSMTVVNICNQELFETCGIAGISIGEP